MLEEIKENKMSELERLKQAVVKAAVAICNEPENIEMMEELKDSISLDIPATFMILYKAVREYEKLKGKQS